MVFGLPIQYFQISRFLDVWTSTAGMATMGKLSGSHLIPFPTHPGIKYVANRDCAYVAGSCSLRCHGAVIQCPNRLNTLSKRGCTSFTLSQKMSRSGVASNKLCLLGAAAPRSHAVPEGLPHTPQTPWRGLAALPAPLVQIMRGSASQIIFG